MNGCCMTNGNTQEHVNVSGTDIQTLCSIFYEHKHVFGLKSFPL